MRNQFTFYKSFDDVIEDMTDKQIAEYMKVMLDVQFLRIKIDDVKFKDSVLNMVWKSQRHSIKTSIKGYLDSQKRESVKNPYLGIYDDSCNPYKGVAQQEQVKEQEQEQVKGKGEEEEQKVKSSFVLNPLVNEDSFNEWVSHKKIKNKGTITKLVNFLIEYDKPTQKQIIDRSIMNNWKGLFEPKGNNNQNKQSQFQTKAEKNRIKIDEYAEFFGHNLNNNAPDLIETCEVIENEQ